MAENNSSAPLKTAEGAVQRDELLQAAIDFIGTLTGMKPPPIEVAPPEVFAPFHAFVERVQAITRKPQAVAAQAAPAAVADMASMADTWESSASDLAGNRDGAGEDYNQGVADGMRICSGDLRAALAATPALPATEDSSAGDQAEVQAEPVAWMRKTDITELTDSEPETNGWAPLYVAPQAQPADALDASRGSKWLTVVYRDVQPGDEAREIGSHQKVSALSWSHAIHDRDAAMAAAQEGRKA